jgi:hypothetical protein
MCSIGILVTSIISFSFIPSLKSNVLLTKCSLYVVLDSSMNGDEKWGGFINLKDQIGNISSLLTSAMTKIGTYFTGDDWLVDDLSSLKTSNLNIYKNNKDSKVTTPNPTSTATALNAGQDIPQIDSIFIKTGMGPNGTFNRMVDDIDRGLRTT